MRARDTYMRFSCAIWLSKRPLRDFTERMAETPPKIHNLIFLIEKMSLEPPDDLHEVIFSLNRVSIPTRYPDDIEKMKKEYNKRKTIIYVEKGKDVLKWLKAQL